MVDIINQLRLILINWLKYKKNTENVLANCCAYPCRLREMPKEDLNPAASRKFDVEAWMPGRREWGELSSASNCTDYQAKRLNIRYKSENGEVKHAHTCNGTAIATTRAMIAVLETHQDPVWNLLFIYAQQVSTDIRQADINRHNIYQTTQMLCYTLKSANNIHENFQEWKRFNQPEVVKKRLPAKRNTYPLKANRNPAHHKYNFTDE